MSTDQRFQVQLKGLPLVEAAQLVSLGGLVCYGVAWIYFASLYARFDLQPELAGIGGEYLLVRAAVLVSAALAVAAIAILLSTTISSWLERGRRGKLGIFYWFVFLDAGLIFGVTATAVSLTIDALWHPYLPFSIVGGLVVAAIVGSFEFMAFLHAVQFSNRPPKAAVLGSPIQLRFALAGALLWLLVLFPAAYVAGHETGNRLRNGDPILLGPIISFPQISVLVELPNPSSSSTSVVHRYCGLRLGTSDQEIIMYEVATHRIVAIPANYAITTITHRNNC